MNPKASIILTTYNRSAFLKEAIESVLNQTFKNFELIIVDDNSTDDTPNVVLSYKDERIIYIRRNINSGYQCVPKNDGIKVAKGKYIAYLDDDNKYTEDHIEVLVDALDSNPDLDVVYGNRQYFSYDGFGETKMGNAKRFDFDELSEGFNYIDTSDIMHRKEVIYKIGGWDPEVKSWGDYDLIARLVKSGCAFKFIPKVITYYYYHKDSFSIRRMFDIKPEESRFLSNKRSLFKKIKNFLKNEIAYFAKDNISLRKEFPKQFPTRALKVNGLDDEIVYENKMINFLKRLLRKFKYKLFKKAKNIKQLFSLSEARKLSNENLKRYAKTLTLQNKKILDVGIGGNPLGGGYRQFFEKENDYKTLDADAKWNPDYVMDISKTTFPDNTWDLVIFTNVLEHIENYADALKEALRILKQDGYLILETPYLYPFHSESSFKDLWRFTVDAYYLLLKDFEIIDIGQFGGEPNMPSLVSALAKKVSYDEYKKVQLKESAWATKDEQYQKLLKDSINYLACKLVNNPDLKILDLGCGDGFGISVFKSHGFNNVIGIDIHPEKIKLAQKLGHNAFEGDIHELPFDDEEFDVVFTSHTLEHSYDIKKVIKEIKRVIRKNGCLFIIVPLEKNIKNIAHMQSIVNQEILINIVNEYQFDIIQEMRVMRMEEELWLLCINRYLENENLPIVVLDFDDFSPSRNNIDLLLRLKEYYIYFKVSLFTAANLDNKFRLSKFKSWCDKIRELDYIELLIHGYDHSPKEFKRISEEKAKKRIVLAEDEFIKAGLNYKKIFRAPYWQINNETYDALSGLGYIIADHKDNLTSRKLRCYQYNWSINDPIPNFPIIRGHGHINDVCENGLKGCFENLLRFPKETKFLTISESIELDSHIIRSDYRK